MFDQIAPVSVSRTVDAVVIGSGHNGLVAAAYLARAGWRVEVLEGNELAGGAVATEELTRPGYRHDTFSTQRTWSRPRRSPTAARS